MRSVTRVARLAVTASPMAGKTYTLFACATGPRARSPCSGGKGDPVAISALPSVQRSRSAGLDSACEVGLDSGKMTGRSQVEAICRTISSVNAPCAVDSPMSAVGDVRRTTSARPVPSHPATSLSSRA